MYIIKIPVWMFDESFNEEQIRIDTLHYIIIKFDLHINS